MSVSRCISLALWQTLPLATEFFQPNRPKVKDQTKQRGIAGPVVGYSAEFLITVLEKEKLLR